MEIKLNEDKSERKIGIIFMIIWFAIMLFYMLWDGWIYEWRECGYNGPNQHFDFNMFDMRWDLIGEEVVYYSTNNLHNIIYLCFFTFLVGWMGLVFGSEKLKQGGMVLMAFPVMAAAATLNPPDHLYIVQIVYDLVHISGIGIGVYLFSKNRIDLKKATPVIMFTWVIFFMSRMLVTEWPYWENPIGYFSVNQINDMPFYLYGFEYFVVILLLYTFNFIIMKINSKFEKPMIRAIVPITIYIIMCAIFLAVGLIQLQTLDMGTCP